MGQGSLERAKRERERMILLRLKNGFLIKKKVSNGA
uniref:Uncharacterized protein n=1 Tax=Nelumbo nucifera TaxID=4432 RepID=A0A822Z3C6_NELNU|nr:TPA_asm: hypothetical protein HUJ06_008590 [Nelumbo nucifera]